MNEVDKKIIEFINENKVVTVCFCNEKNEPYCINCFYAFKDEEMILIFKSSKGTTHDSFIIKGNKVSGTILANQIDLTKVKGIQFSGEIIEEKEIKEKNLNTSYIKKYPFSLAMSGYVWGLKLSFIKYTDNSLGFGKKIIWENSKVLN